MEFSTSIRLIFARVSPWTTNACTASCSHLRELPAIAWSESRNIAVVAAFAMLLALWS